MLVRVDTNELQQMESQIQMLTQFLSIAVYKRKGRKIIVSDKDFNLVKESTVHMNQLENGDIELVWERLKGS